MDFPLIAEHADGILILTGCLGEPVLGPLSRGDEDEARRGIRDCIDTVGAGNVYVEVMEHGIPEESAALPQAVALAAEYGLRAVATDDSHYLAAADADAHDAWLAVRTKARVADTGRYRFHGAGYHVRTETEMRALRPEPWWQDAVTATAEVAARVADRCLPEPRPMLPVYPAKDGMPSRVTLARRVWEGAHRRYGDDIPDRVIDRLAEELEVITNPNPHNPTLDFSDYMLMVADMVATEHAAGYLTGAGRGSAAGSTTAYCLGITDIDPLQHGLLFERFLEPGRTDWPDIDTDVQGTRRDAVIDHLADFWGQDRVCVIGSFAGSKSKRALKDAARVLGAGRVGDQIAKGIPMTGAGPMPLNIVLDEAEPAGAEARRAVAAAGDAGRRVVALARQFEGAVAGYAIHACGVVVADRDLTGLIPLRLDPDSGRAVTEWDSHDIEQFGLVKLDVLGIRSLDVAAEAVRQVAELSGEKIDFRAIPDPGQDTDRARAAWELLRAGRTAGLFQMESSGMTGLLRDMRPDTAGDLSAVIALYRPGPLAAGMHTMYANRKAGREPADYTWATDDPAEAGWLAGVLDDTYGLCVAEGQ